MKTPTDVMTEAMIDCDLETQPFQETVGELIKALAAGGYVIVPKEPTEKMINAALALDEVIDGMLVVCGPARAYEAMIDVRDQ